MRNDDVMDFCLCHASFGQIAALVVPWFFNLAVVQQ